MTSSESHLVTLVKLLDGQLSAAEGIAVREQLASDVALRKHWQRLSNAVGSSTQLTDAEQTSQFDIETVAAFVDGEMNKSEAAAVERALWENSAALREAIAAVRANYAEKSVDVSLQHCLTKVIESDFGIRLADNLGETQTLHSTRQNLHRVNGDATADDDALPEMLPTTERPNIVTPASLRRSKTRLISVSLLAAAVAIFLCAAVFFAVREGERHDDRPIAEQPTTDSHDDSTVGPDTTQDRLPDPKEPNDSDTPQVVNNPSLPLPDKVEPPIPDTPKEKPITPVGDDPGRIVQVVWADVVGIAARRRISSSRWSGLLAAADVLPSDEALAVRTLPQAWVQGQLATGPSVVLAADTEIHLLVRQRETSTTGRTNVDVVLLQGRAAITGLNVEETVFCHDDNHEWAIHAQNDETSIGLVHLDPLRRQIVVWEGAVQIGDMTIEAGQTVTWNGRLFEPPANDASRQTWRQQPRPTLALRQPVIDAINHSNHVLQSLARQSRGGSKQDVQLATHLAFSLDAVTAVPIAARSNNDTHRLAAVRWLLAANDAQPETAAVWQKIDTSSGTGQAKLAVRSWFRAAQSQSKPTRQQLAELSAGLGSQQPIFVRQSAIHFLRQITGQRLAMYDPKRPTKQSIDAVRQQLRRATGNGRRRQP